MSTMFDPSDFWITSDLHLGHPLVTHNRGFTETYHHDSTVMAALSELPDNATLVCLGDISVRKDQYALDKLAELKSAKDLSLILTPGNHDKCHPMFGVESQLMWLPQYQAVFDIVVENFQLNHDGLDVLFTHIPRTDDPYRKGALNRWIARDGFDCVVHGHTHSDQLLAPHHVNVSLEATDFHPIHSSELWGYVKQAVKPTRRVRPKR